MPTAKQETYDNLILQLREELQALDKLLHEYFPLGGHARVEQAQTHVGNMLRKLKEV